MKAAVYRKFHSRKILEIVEQPLPALKDNELLIRVRASSINPLDWRMKTRRPGVDVAGEVERVGKRVTRFKPGDAVFGLGKGAFAEYATASEAGLVSKPQCMTFDQAASIPIAGLTALQGLRDIGHLKAGQKVLINGAAGGVGTFAVQIAKALGAHVTGICSTANVAQTMALGADRVIDYTRSDFTMEEERYDLLMDNVGNRPLAAFRRVLTAHGRCAMIGAPKKLSLVLIRILKSLFWSPFLPQTFKFFIAKSNAADLKFLGELLQSGKVTPAIETVCPLTELAQAIDYAEEGHAHGKLVIRP